MNEDHKKSILTSDKEFVESNDLHGKTFLTKKNFLLIAVLLLLILGSVITVNLVQKRTELQSKAEANTIAIPVSADATISLSKTTKNYGSQQDLKVDDDQATYLRFDLAPLNNQPIAKAVLRLYITNDSSSQQNIREAVTNDWNETQITYATKVDGEETLTMISDTTKNNWKEIDITEFIKQRQGKAISLLIDATKENKNNLYFGSKESANPPQIIVELAGETTSAPATIVPSLPLSPSPTKGATITPITITIPPTVMPTLSSGAQNIRVTNGVELTSALTSAQPGDIITLADGTYAMKSTSVTVGKQNASSAFRLSKSGTATAPIVIQGTRKAVIDGDNDYGLHLFNANYVYLKGITVINGKKGIMLDNANHNIIDGVEVYNIVQEGIHLRSFSSDNIIKNSYVHHTGRDNRTGAIDDQYGEGIYVGSANSNWGTYTSGQPDKSDRNQLLNNVISYTGGEGIDIKEGTINGVIRGNSFDNAGIAGGFADSWLDMKGNNWLVTGNKGINALMDGYQVHGVYPGWGNNNTFTNNTAENVKRNGFWFQNNVTGNLFSCTNTALNAPAGLGNIPCK